MKELILELLTIEDRPLRWLAEQLGISSTTLWRKMVGHSEFKQAEKLAMTQIFGVDAKYFEEVEK